MDGGSEEMLDIVLSYKKIAHDPAKHKVIIKDKTMVQFLAYSLDSNDENVVEASLETLDLLIMNTNNHYDLRNTFGIMEAILYTSNRDDVQTKIRLQAKKLHTALESSAFVQPIGPPRTPVNSRKSLVSNIYSFHVFGLNDEKRGDLEDCLVKVRGVISVVVDVPHQRAMVRVINGGPDAETLVSAVSSKTNMSPVLLVKNSKGQEMLKIDSLDFGDCTGEGDLPDYLPEDESPVKEKAILSFDRIRSNASSWVRSASAFLQDAFYW